MDILVLLSLLGLGAAVVALMPDDDAAPDATSPDDTPPDTTPDDPTPDDPEPDSGPLLSGTAGGDSITTPDGASLVMSGNGDDRVTATATSSAKVSMGDGNDRYTATDSSGVVQGNAGNDSFDYSVGSFAAGAADRSISFAGGSGDDAVTIRATTGSAAKTAISVDLGAGNDSFTVERDADAKIFVFDDAGDDTISVWMGHEVLGAGSGNDVLTLGVTAGQLATRTAAAFYELTPTDRVIINIEAGLQGTVTFTQSSVTEGDLTEVQIDGKTVLVFNQAIPADDPRLTINRNVTFA